MNITKIIITGMGGGAGAICRFLIYEMVLKSSLFSNTSLPFATLLVNILGSFVIGWLAGISQIQDLFSPHIRLLLFVGFLGGFTTFSTFSYELFTMVKSDAMVNAIIYAGAHILFGLLAVALGFYLSTRIGPILFN